MAGTVAVAVSQLAKERNSPRKVPSRLGIDHCSQKLQLFDVTDLLVLLVILTPELGRKSTRQYTMGTFFNNRTCCGNPWRVYAMTAKENGTANLVRASYEIAWQEYCSLPGLTPDEICLARTSCARTSKFWPNSASVIRQKS
jgi:hypothetical protein